MNKTSPAWRLVSAALMLSLAHAPARSAPPPIHIAYPSENASVAFDHVLFEGSVPPGTSLTVSGRAIDVGPDGLFIEWLPLQLGDNALVLEARRGGEISQRTFHVTSSPPRPLPATPTAIAASSITPGSDFKLSDLSGSLSSRTVTVSFQGAPNGVAWFKVGERGPFAMAEQKADDFPGSKYLQPGRYEGALLLQAGDNFQNAAITVFLRGQDGKEMSARAGGTISASADAQPRVGIVTAEPVGRGVNLTATAARNGAARSPILHLRAGMKFLVVGEDASTYTVQIAPAQTVSVLKDTLRILPPGTPLPRKYFARIETKRITHGTQSGTQVRFALPDRVAFSIQQTATPSDQHLDLRLYNTETDIDYMTSAFPDALVRGVRWEQQQDGVLGVRIDLAARQQWGHQLFYEGNTLVLQIKDAPIIARQSPLRGHKILIDPGHGGVELGAPGGFGTFEKDIVLDISRRLFAKLRALGADAILSRTGDVRVPLSDRPLLAENIGAEVLVSIHANALPDGVDPKTQRGTAVYYYHPQARALSETLLSSLLKTLPEAGNDGLHFQNLALTRPTSQLSILVETAFMTDKGNLRLLMSPSSRERFAQALARGLEDFYRSNATPTK